MDTDNCYICLSEVDKSSDNLKICKKNGCKFYIHKKCYEDKKKYEKHQDMLLYDCDICRTYNEKDEFLEIQKRWKDFIRENIINAIYNPGIIGIFIIIYSIYVFTIIVLISRNTIKI